MEREATSATRTTTPSPDGPELRQLLRYGLAIASFGAAVLHLTAAADHRAHHWAFAFFIVSGMLQLFWGGAVLAPQPPRRLLELGAVGSAGMVGVWLVSRTIDISFVPDMHREPVGVKDSVTVIFELLVVGVALVLAWRERAPILRWRVSNRTLAPLAAATALLLVPGLIVPSHKHDGEHGLHEHGILALAEGAHDHGVGSGSVHAHEPSAGHAHAAGAAHAATSGHTHVLGATHEHSSSAPASAGARSAAPTRSSAPDAPPTTGIKVSVRYGPFVLPPASLGGDAHYNRILNNITKPCSDCYIVSAKPNLVYEDGSSANLNSGAMLHHAVWTRPSLNDMTCGRGSAIGSQGLRFFASGNERTEMHFPAGFGYLIGADSWTLIAELMNHSDQTKNLYITLDVMYRPASDHLHNLTPVWMDIDNCADSQYSIPAGKSSQLWTWKSSITGRVVSTGGHVHNAGLKTVLTNETSHQEMCTSSAGYGHKPEFMGTIESMSTCVWDRIGVVRKGEVLGIRAYYDSAQAQSDVMGINIAFVYETTNLSGGTVPPKQDAPAESSGQHGGHHH